MMHIGIRAATRREYHKLAAECARTGSIGELTKLAQSRQIETAGGDANWVPSGPRVV